MTMPTILCSYCTLYHKSHINVKFVVGVVMIQSRNLVQMSDAVAAFYSQPSGQQRGGRKGLRLLEKFAIPLCRNVKDKLCEKIPSVVGKLCDRRAKFRRADARWASC